MTKKELKKLIAECIVEEACEEEGMEEGLFGTLGQMGKQAVGAVKQQYQIAQKADAKNEFAKIKTDTEKYLAGAYKKALEAGTRAGMNKGAVNSAYYRALNAHIQKIKSGTMIP